MTGYKNHLFVCTNSPGKEGKCGSKGAENLRSSLKEKCRTEFGKDVRVNASGCLGYCEKGIAAVIYPKGEWFLELKETDETQLLEALRKLQNP
jgi:(2Fe-2S) ferredoxin